LETCFYDWALRIYVNKDNPRGDLARDMQRDADFPRTNDKKAILVHLKRAGACDAAIQTFNDAWQYYARCQKKAETVNHAGAK